MPRSLVTAVSLLQGSTWSSRGRRKSSRCCRTPGSGSTAGGSRTPGRRARGPLPCTWRPPRATPRSSGAASVPAGGGAQGGAGGRAPGLSATLSAVPSSAVASTGCACDGLPSCRPPRPGVHATHLRPPLWQQCRTHRSFGPLDTRGLGAHWLNDRPGVCVCSQSGVSTLAVVGPRPPVAAPHTHTCSVLSQTCRASCATQHGFLAAWWGPERGIRARSPLGRRREARQSDPLRASWARASQLEEPVLLQTWP